MKDNNNNTIDELLIRYLAGLASDNERLEVESWISSSAENESYFEKFRTIWESSSKLKDYQRIDTEGSLKKVKQRLSSKRMDAFKLKPMWALIRIAAVLAFGLMIYLIFNQKNREIDALAIIKVESGDSVKIIVLPDGSVVNLNRASTIEYSSNFNKSERLIKFDGEAYFEVKPNKSIPFVIETPLSITRVVGTAFNLKANKGENQSILVTHGMVEFSAKNKSKGDKLLLKKDEMALLDENLHKELNANPNVMSWRTGIFVFENEPLESAINLLSDYYQVDFRFSDKKLNAMTISGKYEKMNLQDLIGILELTLQVKIEKKNGQYWLKP